MSSLPSRVLGLALVGALALHAASKDVAHLQEMLWLCHVASALMALGLLAGWHRVVAACFLLHVGFGSLAWLIDALTTFETTPTSVLLHLLSLVAGALEVRRKGWPRGMVLPTWLFFSLWVLSCHWTTDPAFNVNMAHAPWGPWAGVVGGVWWSGLINSTAMLVGFLLADAVLRRVTRSWSAASDSAVVG
jgi:hypothetical protein